MKKKNNWKKIFSSKKMSYYKLSNQYIKLNFNKKISFFFKSYTLTKIIYPLLTIDIFREMIFFFTKQLKDYKKKK